VGLTVLTGLRSGRSQPVELNPEMPVEAAILGAELRLDGEFGIFHFMYRITVSITTLRRRAKASGPCMSREKICEKVALLATLKKQRALIVMWMSMGSSPLRKAPALQPRA